jgi:hypothetical protein
MKIDLSYLTLEDRIRLSVRGKMDWLITRSLLLRLIGAWVQKLQVTDLPPVGFHLGQRDIAQEHALSLEFDAPKLSAKNVKPETPMLLLQEVKLNVDALGANLVMRGQQQEVCLRLTRKESHLLLEMFAKKAREAKWVEGVELPDWLGSTRAD